MRATHVLPVGTVWALSGHCVGTEWALSGHCLGRGVYSRLVIDSLRGTQATQQNTLCFDIAFPVELGRMCKAVVMFLQKWNERNSSEVILVAA